MNIWIYPPFPIIASRNGPEEIQEKTFWRSKAHNLKAAWCQYNSFQIMHFTSEKVKAQDDKYLWTKHQEKKYIDLRRRVRTG